MIELKNISKVYGFGEATTVALEDINLEIGKGEFVAIMGPSGSGKSTLLNILGLLDTPTHGEYRLKNRPVAGLRESRRARLRREEIGFVFQSFNLLPRMTVIDNVALPLMYQGVGHVRRLERASKALAELGLKEREYYFPNQLSGGQAQRVAIARALVTNPSLILADEPTGNLDTKTSTEIIELLKDLHQRGRTVVLVTHEPDLAAYAERVVEVIDGKLSQKPNRRRNRAKTAKKPRRRKTAEKAAAKRSGKKAARGRSQ